MVIPDFRQFVGMYSYSNHLQHHGILGMHWGVRRYQNLDGSLTDKGRARLQKIASNPRLVNRENRQARRIYKSEARRASTLAKQYKKDANKEYKSTQQAQREVSKTFPIGRKRREARLKATLSEENYRRSLDKAEEFLLKSSIMTKKLNEVKSGDLQAGRDFLIQTDWEFNPFPNKVKTVVQEENRDRNYSTSKRTYH